MWQNIYEGASLVIEKIGQQDRGSIDWSTKVRVEILIQLFWGVQNHLWQVEQTEIQTQQGFKSKHWIKIIFYFTSDSSKTDVFASSNANRFENIFKKTNVCMPL